MCPLRDGARTIILQSVVAKNVVTVFWPIGVRENGMLLAWHDPGGNRQPKYCKLGTGSGVVAVFQLALE